MLDLAIASDLAVRATRATAGSARPDAPVVPDRVRAPRPARAARTRTVLARSLRRAAAVLEPRERPMSGAATPACR